MKISFIARLDSTYRLRIPKEIIAAKNPPRKRYYNVIIEEIEDHEESNPAEKTQPRTRAD